MHVPAENMRIVLLEAAHTGQAVQSAAELVAMQHAEVRHSDGQLPVGACAVPKHHAVPCIAQESGVMPSASP